MSALHIVQGGIENGDKRWLERAAKLRLNARIWITPKSAVPGDYVVVFIGSYGFFATARVTSDAKPRTDWKNRYGAGLTAIRLIKPAISVATIRRAIPALSWAIYPRSITTPVPAVAKRIRALIANRRRGRLPNLDDEALNEANIDELRRVALLSAQSVAPQMRREVYYRARSLAIHLYVLRRANGYCEGCGVEAPFSKTDGTPYLEPHHTMLLADDGPDHPARVIGLCPNCHRRAHHARNAKAFNSSLKKRAMALEAKRAA